MQRCFLVLCAAAGLLSVSSPASAGTADVVEAAATNTQAAPPAGLPTGDDGSYRWRMLAWNAPPRPAARSLVIDEPLALPVAHIARLSSGFGVRSDPLGLGQRMHSGIDIPGQLGTSIMATGPGVVSFVGRAGGYGNLVVIDHGNGLRTRYGHLLRPLVSPGETVRMGSVIGLMGSTGRSTGPHLHYEVRIGGAAVNPLASRFVAQSNIAEIAEAPAPPVAERWQGWARSELQGELPLAVIR
ncbi:MAG: M23 family metallopeptidase [Sphingomonadales bacterium]|nr:M23 family metallopeptidase [Sphingomonadales bacterium]